MREPVLVFGSDATIRYANPAVERVLGHGARDLCGHRASDLLHPGDVEAFSKVLAPGGDPRAGLRWRHKDLSWRSIEGVVVALTGDDPTAGGIVWTGDASPRPTREGEAAGGKLEMLSDFGAALGESAIVAETDAKGRITSVNGRFCELSGYSREELVGRALMQDLIREPAREAVRDRRVSGAGQASEEESVRGPSWEAVAGGDVWRGELRSRAKDGSTYSVDTTVMPLVDEAPGEPSRYLAIGHDVTGRMEVEEALRAAETRYRTLAEQVQEDIFLVDVATMRILEANPSPYLSLGYAEEELKGLSLYAVAAHDRAAVDTDVERVLGGGDGFLGERRYRRKDGSLADVEVSAGAVPYGKGTAVCIVAQDVTERKRTKRDLQKSLNALLATYEAGHILGSTLEAEEIGSRLLHLMQRISSSVTAVISVPDDRRRLRVWRAVGFENLWRRARFTPEVQDTLHEVFEGGEHAFSQVRSPIPEEEPLAALFLPLRIRNRIVGVLEVYGPDDMTERETVDILLNLTTKAASALENARLYGKLAERERQLRELVGKLLVTHEEERRRVAYEVHDGPTQVAVAAFQHLQAFARLHPPGTPEGRKTLAEAVELAQRTVRESRHIIANLRPTVLDDFGLATAIRSQAEELRAEGWRVSYETDLGAARMPGPVESALYRVAQEALTNVRKHARTNRVRLRLSRAATGVRLQVRDFGIGVGSGRRQTGGPGERVGLEGMRERVALLGGELKIHSKEGVGTLITADVPLPEGATDDGADLVRRLYSAGRTPPKGEPDA